MLDQLIKYSKQIVDCLDLKLVTFVSGTNAGP